jgi:hypothetical protein
MTIEDGTHSGSRNVIEKFTSHTLQNPQNQKSVFIPRSKSKININLYELYYTSVLAEQLYYKYPNILPPT